MDDRLGLEADKEWFEDYKKEHPSLNIGTKKEVVRWCYKKFIAEQCDWRNLIKC